MRERKRNIKWEINSFIKVVVCNTNEGNLNYLEKKKSLLAARVTHFSLRFFSQSTCKVNTFFAKTFFCDFLFLHRTTLILWCKGWLSVQTGISCLKWWLMYVSSPDHLKRGENVHISLLFRTLVTNTNTNRCQTQTHWRKAPQTFWDWNKSISLSEYKSNNNNYDVILAQWVNAGLWG